MAVKNNDPFFEKQVIFCLLNQISSLANKPVFLPIAPRAKLHDIGKDTKNRTIFCGFHLHIADKTPVA